MFGNSEKLNSGNNNCSYSDIISLNSWIAHQSWRDVIFLHWPISPQNLEHLIPMHGSIRLDTYEDNAWISLVAFKVKDAHIRKLPVFPPVSDFTELNLRTYVKYNGKPGISFLQIDVNKVIAAEIYKLTGLPYHYRPMEHRQATFNLQSTNPHKSQMLDICWKPGLEEQCSEIDKWLTERYCSYQTINNKVYCYPVCHLPWKLYKLNPLKENIHFQWQDKIVLTGPNRAIAHYSPGVEALFYWRKEI